MDAIKLTNIPRLDLPRLDGHAQSRHVYPFGDQELAPKYGRLTLPSSNTATTGKTNHPALQGTWFDVKVTHFGNGRGTLQRWPFARTQTEQAQGGIPTDKGTLDPEDLGDVLDVLPADFKPGKPAKYGVATVNRDAALCKKEVTNVRCRKFLLPHVPESLRNLLWKWYIEGMVPAKKTRQSE